MSIEVQGSDKQVLTEADPSDQPTATITLTISGNQFAILKDLADRVHITVEQLVEAQIEQMLIPPDQAYQEDTKYLLAKNAELYRRLA